ncbi:MAG: T9SS type A sorting domain-containing protein [Lewinellaceae bacterium]|nr:T9SS type A sorting domain-containing protein [Lewinellaceae bacterium]
MKSSSNIFIHIFLVVLFFSGFVEKAASQLPDGSVVPNMTLTDINGNNYDLYEVLDSGRGVILDVFTTWCGPCWAFHNSHILRDIYNCYGPEGTGNVMVFAIEVDPGTTLDDLMGNTGTTRGDWLAETPYPFVDNASLASVLQINFYPTIYKICPIDKTIYELGIVPFETVKAALLNDQCTVPSKTKDASFGCREVSGFSCPDSEAKFDLEIFNAGTQPLTSATIEALVNGNIVSSMEWTGNLATFEEETLSFEPLPISTGTEITFNIVAAGDESPANNLTTRKVSHYIEMLTLDIEIMTDQAGRETYWAILDVDNGNTVVAEGGNHGVGLTNIGTNTSPPPADPNAYSFTEQYNIQVVLPHEGCYDFVITDYYGDGMCCELGVGYYKVRDISGNVIFEGGHFGAIESNPFHAVAEPTTSTGHFLNLNSLSIYPNPAIGEELIVDFHLAHPVSLELAISNLTGQIIKSFGTTYYHAGENNIVADISELPSGLYLLTTLHNEERLVKKFAVLR